MNTFVPPLAGAISDKVHLNFGKRQPLMVSGFLFASLFTMTSAFFVFPWRVGNWDVAFTLLAIVSTFQWIGLSNGIGSFTGLVPDTVPEKRLGLAGGILGIGRSLGNLLSVLLAGVIVQFIPYPFNFICAYGLAALVFINTALFTFCSVPEKAPKENPEPFSWKDFVQSFFLWPPTEYWNFYCVFASRWMGVYSFVNYLQYYLQDVFEDPFATVGSSLLIASVLAIGVLVSPFAGVLSDYIPRKWIVIAASFFTFLVIIANLLLTLFKGPLWAVYLACGFLGVGVGTFYAVDWALGIDAIPRKENIAKDMGIWHVSDTVPSMIAPLITGLILSNGKPVVGERYAWSIAFAFSSFWFLLSAFCIFFYYSKKKIDEQDVENKEGKSILLDVIKSPQRSPRGMPIEQHTNLENLQEVKF